MLWCAVAQADSGRWPHSLFPRQLRRPRGRSGSRPSRCAARDGLDGHIDAYWNGLIGAVDTAAQNAITEVDRRFVGVRFYAGKTINDAEANTKDLMAGTGPPCHQARDQTDAKNTLAGIELVHMIRKGQMIVADENPMSFAEQFYALAG